MRVEFHVHGTPQPQGSTKAFLPRGWTRPIVTTDNRKLKPWRQEVSGMASTVMQATGQAIELGAVRVTISFWFQKPKSTKKSVVHKITRPDIDKLCRAGLDSLTGIVFKDDSQVVETHIFKNFGDAEGARILVESL